MRTRSGLGLLLSSSLVAAGCVDTPAPVAAPPPVAQAAPPLPPPSPPSAAAVFARYRAATGGAAWDHVQATQVEGTLTAGGLSGPVKAVQDVRGRSFDSYELGPVRGADGYDGTTAWRRDPGGEVVTLDAQDARETAATSAWLGGTAMFRADFGGASVKPPRQERDGAHVYDVVEAVPPGGHLATMWFDQATGFLYKVVTHQDGNTVTTVSDDYRKSGELVLPFHTVTDSTDPAGRTDPRDRTETRVSRNIAVAMPPDSAFAMPAMVASAHIANPSGVTRVPFELINNHIYASGSVDGHPTRFLVDTGGINMLSNLAAARLGLKPSGKMAAHGVGDDAPDLGMADARELRLGDAVLEKPVMFIADAVDFPTLEGTVADGLVGFELFRRFRVSIDYDKHVLTLTDPAKFEPPAGAHVVPFDLADRIPRIKATLDGMPMVISVDTGSRSSLTLNAPFVAAHDLVARYQAAPESISGWGAGGPHRGREARFATLVLGDVTVRDLTTELSTSTKGGFASDSESGNLGGGILKRFTVSFDYDAKRMYLVPNRSLAKPDPYDRSGMWINAENDHLVVMGVTAGAAADKAQLHVGDKIDVLAGEPVKRHPLYEWRQRLRELPAGTKLELVLHDGDGEQRRTLVLADQIPEHGGSR